MPVQPQLRIRGDMRMFPDKQMVETEVAGGVIHTGKLSRSLSVTEILSRFFSRRPVIITETLRGIQKKSIFNWDSCATTGRPVC